MILNIDLGTLYLKCAAIDNNSIVKSEVIRMEKNSPSVVEVLISSVVDTYSQLYPITQVNIIPNLEFIEFQLVNSESIMASKYQNYMKKQIKNEGRERRRQLRMGKDYKPLEQKTDMQEYNEIVFEYNVLDYEVFHSVERSTLMETDILLEYVDKQYLGFLTKVANKLGKEVSVVSPLRVLRALPFPRGQRIIVNYGHKYILYAVINNNNQIIEVNKEFIDVNEDVTSETLLYKHSQIQNPNQVHIGIQNRVQEIRNKYTGYPLYTIGGNANFLQEDLQVKNDFEGFSHDNNLPLVVENLIVNTGFSDYDDLQYNNISMNLRNRIFGAFTSTSQVSNTAIAILGDVAIAVLVLVLISSYKINSEYLRFKNELQGIQSQIESYTGSDGRIVRLEEHLETLKEGKPKTYYNMAEFLKTIESPLEIECIEVDKDHIKIVAYADNTALIYQFLNTVKFKQADNFYTKFSLSETDIQTVYKNGAKLDRVVFEGKIY